MTAVAIFEKIKEKKSFLCIGLDTDISKIPSHLLKTDDPVFEFNKQIIDATLPYAVAYKPNLAFYEAMGVRGLQSLQKTLEYIPKDIFTIADAKRGDIGNTSGMYAKGFFDKESSGFDFDAVTVAPYMGADSVMPFLEFPKKWVILLGLTSNKGSEDFQFLETGEGKLFEQVIKKSCKWGNKDQLMFVIGATHPEMFEKIRNLAPEYFFLVPGVGAQGGSLAEISQFGMNKQCGLLVNSSRNIIYASSRTDFAIAAEKEAKKLSLEMAHYLDMYLK